MISKLVAIFIIKETTHAAPQTNRKKFSFFTLIFSIPLKDETQFQHWVAEKTHHEKKWEWKRMKKPELATSSYTLQRLAYYCFKAKTTQVHKWEHHSATKTHWASTEKHKITKLKITFYSLIEFGITFCAFIPQIIFQWKTTWFM